MDGFKFIIVKNLSRASVTKPSTNIFLQIRIAPKLYGRLNVTIKISDLCTFPYLYGEPAPFSADSQSCKMDMPAKINPCKNILESVEIVENAQF